MKNFARAFIILIAFTAIVSAQTPPFESTRIITVDAGEHGIEPGVDATLAVRNLLDRYRDTPGVKIVFPKGTYEFWPEEAFQKYVEVSNHDNGPRRIAFPLIGFDNIEIDGQGSEFLFHGRIIAFEVEDSSNVVLRNFSIDYDQPFNFQGSIVAVDEEEKWIDIEPYEECKAWIYRDTLRFGQTGYEPPQGGKLDPWTTPWEQDIRWTIFFNEDDLTPVANLSSAAALPDSYLNSPDYRVEKVGENRYRFHNACRDYPSVGMALIAKGMLRTNRITHAIHLLKTTNVQLENVNVYHAGGMGLIAERTENVSMTDFNVRLREGSGRIISTTADATHFVGCRGLIEFDGCLFENMLDDATNVHGAYVRVIRPTGERSVLARLMHFQQFGFIFADAGDQLRLSSQETLVPYGEAMAESVRRINDQIIEITFDRPIEGLLQPETIIDNPSWQADVVMRNCTIRRNRARSILLTTAGSVLIENNTFDRSSMMNILMEGDAFVWHESGPTFDTRIIGNTFIDLNAASPSILISPKMHADDVPDGPFHHNVVIEDNEFVIHGDQLLKAYLAENIVFQGNTIRAADDFLSAPTPGPTFDLRLCEGVKIVGNDFVLEGAVEVRTDDATSGVVVEGNEGMGE